MTTRREFITLLGGVAAWPLAARAQQSAGPTIGILHPGSPEANAKYVAGLRKGLAEAGYVEGRNIAIEYRWGHGDSGRLPELASDLIGRRYRVRCVTDQQEHAAAPAGSPAPEIVPPAPEQAISEDPVVRAAVEDLGAQIVQQHG